MFDPFGWFVLPFAVLLVFFAYKCMRSSRKGVVSQEPKKVRLGDGRVVTIYANGICLNPEGILHKQALEFLAKKCTVYPIVKVADEEERIRIENDVTKKFEGIPINEILYCQTDNGRTSMARQLESYLHIDDNPNVLKSGSGFFKGVLIAPKGKECDAGAFHYENLSDFVKENQELFA